ncbi:amidase [Desulfatibacillum aliphaticivorans]|uniref:amidase n=1 Tax=Desulfatibacillum aliphaticivorans TaxID=218208 RepID=UPI0004062ED1|nr:amidase [Desulfatibacillum aliphaticivorans]
MDKLLTLSGTKIAAMIREGKITSRKAVETHIEHAKKINPWINAIVADRYDQALDEADAADAFLKENGPENCPSFHGVPCSIKECFSLTGMPHTSGLVARKGIIEKKDATAAARMRRAGLIPIGVTNISELCMWMESHNKVYGTTNNCYDLGRIVGGSSGGEGCIVSSGASPFGLGSDVGGSIRMPAFFNGVFGHKPTGGAVPNTGQIPLAHGRVAFYCTTGPLCRKAEDLMPLLKIMAGPDGKDPECTAMDFGDPASVDFSRLNVLSVPENGAVRVHHELVIAQKKAADALEKLGASVKHRTVNKLKWSFAIWSSMLNHHQTEEFGVQLGQGKRIPVFWELFKWALRASDHTLPALALALGERIPMPTEKFIKMGRELRRELIELIGPDGVMLYPSYSKPAPRHLEPLMLLDNFVYTAIINVMGFPSTQVPLGLSKKGLPVGVQVVGTPGNDHKTIAVAMELEKSLGGWVVPKLAEKVNP